MQITIPFNYAALFDGNNIEHLPYREKAQALFELIKDCQNMNGWAFFKLKWLAKRLEVTKRYVQKLVKVLRDACLIEVRRREQNFYRVNPLLEKPERKIKSNNAAKPLLSNNARAMHDKAASEVGKQDPAIMPIFNEEEGKAITEAYEASKLESSFESIAIIEEQIEGEMAEITEVIQEAAKEVKKESKYQRPREIREYLDRVKTKLANWQIDVPHLLLRDLVLQVWRNWT